jgi:tetratricopeptide (TPR) repeat protein
MLSTLLALLLAAAPGDANAQTMVAELALERGNCRAAAEAYAEAARGDVPVATLQRAFDVAFQCHQYEPAAAIAKTWRKRAPDDALAAKSAALVALTLGRNAEGAQALREAVRLGTVKPSAALAELAPAVAATDNEYGGYMALRGVAPLDQFDAAALTALAESAHDAWRFADARELAQLATKADPKSGPAWTILARTLADEGDANGAIAAANTARQVDPGDSAFALASTLIALDRLEEAHQELERLLADDDAAPEAERRLALLAFNEGDDDQAAGRFSERLRTGDGPAEAMFYLAALAERRGNDEVALSLYGRLIVAGAGMLPRTRAAAILMKKGERERAFTLLDEQATLEPNDAVDVAQTKARLLVANGSAAEAVTLLDAALELYPGHPQLLYQRALAYESAGDVKAAIAGFEALYKARPEDPELMNALGYTLADHREQLPRAASLIDAALTLTPDSPAILDSQGWVRFRRGDAEGALPPLERAYRLSRETEIAAHWGEVLWALDRKTEARAVWARALARDPDSTLLKDTVARFVPVAAP